MTDESPHSRWVLPENGLRYRLRDWTDWDLASYQLGRCLGLFEGQAFETDVKHVFWTENPLGLNLLQVLGHLVDAGVLEIEAGVAFDGEDDDNDEIRYRWKRETT